MKFLNSGDTKILFMALVIGLLFTTLAFANPESWYRDKWCAAPFQTEVKVDPDDRYSPRCDCVTNEYAVEVDFAEKWYNGVGQCLYYSALLNKLPGLLIIVEDQVKDKKYVDRLYETVLFHKLPITIWIVDSQGNELNWK